MSKIIVVGDVHGDLNQLMYPLIHFMKNKREYRKLIYLGDYIDRGESNVYIYEIIRWIMEDVKDDDIIFLRGNHESYDTAVYDYICPNSSNEKFIKTFIFDGFAKLKMNIVYYDELTNILFSHSPLSRDLNECLAMNDTKTNMVANSINTYTNDKENKMMTYRNIHGHEHFISDTETINAFFKGYRKMICLDDDASYGIQLVKQYPSYSNLVSHVKFMELTNNSYKIISKNIKFKSEHDYNNQQFNVIKNELSNLVNISDSSVINKLNFNNSKQFFINSVGTNNIDTALIQKIRTKNKEKTKGVVVYYHDLPKELCDLFNISLITYHIPLNKTSQHKTSYEFITVFKFLSTLIYRMILIIVLIISCVVITKFCFYYKLNTKYEYCVR